MKKISRYTYFILAATCITIAALSACTDAPDDANQNTTNTQPKASSQLAPLYWLVGIWHQTTPNGVIYETWAKNSDGTLSGKSGFITPEKTTIDETITIAPNGNEVYYTPTVKSQNKGKAIPFKMTIAHNDIFVFENPDHDFPQKITYARLSDDTIIASISGTVMGKQHSEDFEFIRMSH